MKHGNEGSGAFSYSSYSALLSAQGDFETAYEFGRLSLRILEQYDAREYSARVLVYWNVFSRHFKENLRDCLHGCQEAYSIALESGDVEFAGWAAVECVYFPILLGHPLSEVDANTARWSQSLLRMRHQEACNYVTVAHQAVQNLRGLSADPCLLVGAIYDENVKAPSYVESGNVYATGLVFLFRLMLCGFLGRFSEAIALSARPEIQVAIQGGGGTFLLSYLFFDALAQLALPPASPEERERTRTRVQHSLAKMRVWAESAPMNYAAKHALIDAEQNRVRGRRSRPGAVLSRHGSGAGAPVPHDEALATERFALFLNGLGEHEASRFFMAKARHVYHVWGAEAKVREMDNAFPELRPLALALTGSSLRAPLLPTPPPGRHLLRFHARVACLRFARASSRPRRPSPARWCRTS